MSASKHTQPSLLESLLPVLFLIVMLASSVVFFGSDSSYGPNQIALILSAAVAALIGLRHGYTWKQLEKGIVHGISLSTGALLILLVVGSLIGTWILAGVVPTMIYYGLMILHPSVFYAAACAICALVAIATGSSWTTASTVGIALVGIATALGLNVGIAAGAIISGSYFGDKLSPLSDTTNLAPAMAGTDLFTHIRHMLWTTVPSIAIALVAFTIIGLMSSAKGTADLTEINSALREGFVIGPHLLLPPVVVLVLVIKKMPAFPALLIGALVGGLFAVFFQQEAVLTYVGDTDLPRFFALLKGFWSAMFTSYSASTSSEALNELLNRGGMSSMLNTVWLIMAAMTFGGVMETTKMLERIAKGILSLAHSTGSLIAATLATSIGMNIVASDQYIAIVIPGRMFRAEFERRRLKPKNLSRCLEDAGTLTSPMIPWNTCGAFMASSLGVATVAYLPFCFFNMLNPVISAIYGFTGFTIEKYEDGEAPDAELELAE